MVFRKAALQMSMCLQKGLLLQLSVNISACSLSDTEMLRRIVDCCSHSNVKPDMFTLEIIESVSAADSDSVIENLNWLRRLGFLETEMPHNLITPFSFLRAGKTLKNRAVLAPMTHNMSAANGNPSQSEIDWLTSCAKGGFGMLITAATQVATEGRCWPGQPALITSEQQLVFSSLAGMAQQFNAVVVMQLHHGGLRAPVELNNVAPVGPSAIAPGGRYPLGVRAMKEDDIEGVITSFVNAAVKAYEAGLGGVELHAAHNFLLCNFLNPWHNRRNDKWGGNYRNRSRIIVQIIKGIRRRVPRNFLIGVRLSPESYGYIQGIALENQLRIARYIATKDIDYLHFSMGNTFKFADDFGSEKRLLDVITDNMGETIPLMVAGGIFDKSSAEQALQSGIDLTAIGASALGNPDWINKIMQGLPLERKPFTPAHLSVSGFNSEAISYLRGFSGLVKSEL